MSNLRPIAVTALCLGVTIAARGQEPEPLVLGVHYGDHPDFQSIIRPALMFNGQNWLSLDDALSLNDRGLTHERTTRGLPGFDPGLTQAGDNAKRVPLATLAALGLGNKAVNLKNWIRFAPDGKPVTL